LAASPLFRLSDVFAAARPPAGPVVDFGPALPPALPPAAPFSMRTVAVVQRPSPTLRKTTTLPWKSNSTCDAVMLAGVLKSNRALTELTMAPGGELGESEREELGKVSEASTCVYEVTLHTPAACE